MHLLRRIAKWIGWFFLCLAILVVVLAVLFFVTTKFYGNAACTVLPTPSLQSATSSPLTDSQRTQLAAIPDYSRSEETTFLTFPEWYIVYSAREYAGYLERGGLPSGFPYFISIAQFWCGYGAINTYNSAHYPANLWGNVEMITIGASYSTEYLMKGVYEGTVGRLSEFFGGGTTDEDAFMRRVATDYAYYLDVTPWYRYPFFPTIGKLWRETALWGAHPIRTWERKIFLTSQFAVAGAWGFVIEKATNDTGVYPPAATEIKLLVGVPLPSVSASDERIRVEKDLGDGTAVLVIPRYQEFTSIMIKFAEARAHVLDIAGAHLMLATIFAPDTWNYDLPGSVMFIEPLPTDPHMLRIGAIVPVADVLEWVRQAKSRDLQIEHLYDY